jgi:imidazolonepropionase
MTDFDLLIHEARVVTCDAGAHSASNPLGIVERGAVGVIGQKIAYVGKASGLTSVTAKRQLDVKGRVVLPGLVDPHTHLLYAGSRVQEFCQKMAGQSYLDIAAAGGGIMSTVQATRKASDESLLASAQERLLQMRAHGVTAVEIKSGYGLDELTELRCLALMGQLTNLARISRTFLGAHAIPPEYATQRDAYVRLLCEKMIPRVAAERLADSCDVYIDQGAFSLHEARAILTAARQANLPVRGHVGQFQDVGGAELLAEFGALSADHLEAVSDAALRALARAGVVAVLLPAAWTTLRQQPPDVARLRGAGLAMAVGTDCNPGTSPCTDLTLCAALAIRQAGLTPEDAILAVTQVAAKAAGIANVGCISVGHWADLAIYDTDDPFVLGYILGDLRASHVIFAGREVLTSDQPDAVRRRRHTIESL